tara:strand:+ start:754 stop:975 length:222 start_codon:yes stop_codon:yes gene_type:complete
MIYNNSNEHVLGENDIYYLLESTKGMREYAHANFLFTRNELERAKSRWEKKGKPSIEKRGFFGTGKWQIKQEK